jgi:hypothetical protein
MYHGATSGIIKVSVLQGFAKAAAQKSKRSLINEQTKYIDPFSALTPIFL